MRADFSIYEVAGFKGGTVAICPQPEDLGELGLIAAWQPDIVVTHTTEPEFPPNYFLPIVMQDQTFEWVYVPIADFGAPIGDDAKIWANAAHELTARLSAGARILCHCKGGQGRSGMMALRLLVEQGEGADAALARLRAVRPGAVETDEQFVWAAKGF